jgi:FtsP/CotA-like multicopper oxidase with cupredoxin domain
MTYPRICKLIVIILALIPASVSAALCPRPLDGAIVVQPAELRSSGGALRTDFSFRSETDPLGLTRYCYVSGGAAESPTLRVHPGDEVILNLTNNLTPASRAEHHEMPGSLKESACGSGHATELSTNLHFHGLDIPPSCHQDDVIHTAVQPGDPAFQYRFKIPIDEPPGLYWYHPHPHGYSEQQVLGGASGALIVEGIAEQKPEVAGLPERILVFRDQPSTTFGAGLKAPAASADKDDRTGRDVSLNFVPVTYPLYRPAVIRVKPDRREFWRVLNASADTYFDLRINSVENGQRVPLELQMIAVDGYPLSVATPVETGILIPPGGRAEFIVTTPHAGALAQLVSLNYDTGRDGSANPERVIATIVASANAPEIPAVESMPGHTATPRTTTRPTRARKLYFSENRVDLSTPGRPAEYYITVEGHKPAVFDMNSPKPDVTVRQGTVEDWVIQNRARESHVFHIHQLHFQLIARDGVVVDDPALRDTIDIPAWSGAPARYPSVRLRMDFRSPAIIGTFLFHCHILEHEDGGMMGTIRVVKPGTIKVVTR